MKINSPEALRTAREVFRAYGNSWAAVRAAGTRDANGVLVVPATPPPANVAQTRQAAARRARQG